MLKLEISELTLPYIELAFKLAVRDARETTGSGDYDQWIRDSYAKTEAVLTATLAQLETLKKSRKDKLLRLQGIIDEIRIAKAVGDWDLACRLCVELGHLSEQVGLGMRL